MLYDYTENYYTDTDTQILAEMLSLVGYTSQEEQSVINDMCDFIIIEKIRIQALKNETERTHEHTAEILRRIDRVNTIYKTMARLYPHSKAYIKIRQECNRIYTDFGGAKDD